MSDSNICPICKTQITSCDHRNSQEHRFNFVIYEYNHYRKRLLKDRHGIVFNMQPKIQNDVEMSFHYKEKSGNYVTQIRENDLLRNNKQIDFICHIKNTTKSTMFLKSVNLLHPSPVFHFKSSIPNFGGNKDRILGLEPGSSYKFKITFIISQLTYSSFKIPVACHIQTANKLSFTIPRSLVVVVNDDLDLENTQPNHYTSKPWTNISIQIPSRQKMHYTNKYSIPNNYLALLKYGLQHFKSISFKEELDLTELRDLMKKPLGPENYAKYWHIVMWLEEVAQTLMLNRYNMEKVTMLIKNGDILVLEVSGLAEKRPSVIIGDMVRIRIHEQSEVYTGVVKKVNDNTVEIFYVDIELVHTIQDDPEILLDVAFILNRLMFERMHEGIDKMQSSLVWYLFPTEKACRKTYKKQQQQHTVQKFYNNEIAGNLEQRNAVEEILNSTIPFPYIVFGPPGTGKSITIVEAILQIKTFTSKRILVCAPANSACDLIASKLIQSQQCSHSELIRIHSDTRETTTLTEELKKYSNMEESGSFKKTSLQDVMSYRIVITTLALIGRNMYRDYTPDCVFIDEAAQASEPETAVALSFVQEGNQLVLAGDPKQLGPMVISKCAEKYGFGISLIERLMETFELYKPNYAGFYDNNYITMLKRNFRSHADILEIPNKLFYESNLTPHSIKAANDPIVKIAIYPYIFKKLNQKIKPGRAMEFCSISSKENTQGSSPSFYNNSEVQMVVQYVRALVNLDIKNRVDVSEIGVVTPYKRQVYKIIYRLKSCGFEGVEVGTTETFQGREKRVIIISTVRAQHSRLLEDRQYNMGFVRDDKRFNVAVTRAISKLIVIGCQPVLITDSKWLKLISKCQEFDTYFGAPFEERDAEFKHEVVKRMGNFKKQDDQYRK